MGKIVWLCWREIHGDDEPDYSDAVIELYEPDWGYALVKQVVVIEVK